MATRSSATQLEAASAPPRLVARGDAAGPLDTPVLHCMRCLFFRHHHVLLTPEERAIAIAELQKRPSAAVAGAAIDWQKFMICRCADCGTARVWGWR